MLELTKNIEPIFIRIALLFFVCVWQLSCSDNSIVSPVQKKNSLASYALNNSIINDIFKFDARTIYNDIYEKPCDKAAFKLSCIVLGDNNLNCRKPVWSPDGKYLGLFASSDFKTQLYILKIVDGKCKLILTGKKFNKDNISASFMIWNQKDPTELLVYYSNHKLYKGKIGYTSIEWSDEIYTFQKNITDMIWNGSNIYVILEGVIYRVPSKSGSSLELLPHTPIDRTFNYCNLVLHPNGKSIIYEQWNNDNSRKIWMRKHSRKQGIELIPWEKTIQHSPMISPTGQFLAFISNGELNSSSDFTARNQWKIFVWDLSKGKLVQDCAFYKKNENDANILCWINNDTLLYLINDTVDYNCFQKWNVKHNSKRTLYINKHLRFKLPLIPAVNNNSLCRCEIEDINCDGVNLRRTVELISYFDFYNNYFAFSGYDSKLGQYRLYIGKDNLMD